LEIKQDTKERKSVFNPAISSEATFGGKNNKVGAAAASEFVFPSAEADFL